MTESEKYFYSKDLDTLGPFDAEKISELIQKGEIKSSDWMFTASKNWVVASSFTEFKVDFSKKGNASTATISKSSSSKTSKNSILKLPWINENPFRLLDIPVTATKREIEKSLTKAKAFAKVGKPLSPKSDYGLPFSPSVSMDLLEQAKSDIDQPERRIRSSIFWFWEGSAIDKMAFDAIEKKDEGRASEIWERVCKDKSVSKSNFSSARNLSLYRLANAGNSGNLSEQSLRDSLSLAGKFFSSEYLDTYLDSLPVEPKKIPDSHYHAKDFADHVVNSLSEFLDKSNITLNKFIEYFEHFPKAAVDSVKSKFTKKEIALVETEVENAKRTSAEEPAEALKSANNLLSATKNNLKLLSEILGEDDLKYKGLCNEVASQLRQGSLTYFNYASEASPSFDPGDDCLKLVNEALALYSEGGTGKKLREDKEFLEDWIENKDQRESGKKATELAESIKSNIERAERTATLSAAQNLVRNCIPKIEEAKKILNSYEVYIKVSDWVASVATSICVQCCNESSHSASVYNEAVKVMNVIKQLEMSGQVRDYFNRNMTILSSNAYAASEAERKASSGCYIATMVYGSYDSPEVMILRNYRDQKLKQHLFGRIFIKTYYFVSPPFVSLTKDIPFVHKPIRYLLNKIIKCISGK
jgi:hypothetical protein